MAAKELIIDLSQIDLSHVAADIEEIRSINRQRFEMEQINAIVFEDPETFRCVGVKHVTQNEFWVRGHMPGMPLMPGVIMLEAAAQTCSYFATKHDLLGAKVIGFGGLEDIRFRDPVIPGDTLYLLCVLDKIRRGRMIICRFQGVVRNVVVVEGVIKGIPLPVEALSGGAPNAS